MSNKKYLSVVLKVDKDVKKCVLTRTYPMNIDIPFIVYFYSKEKKAIIGEAVCDDIEDVSNPAYIAKRTGYSEEGTVKYLQGCDGYLWRLKSIQRYKSYRELSYFGLKKLTKKWGYAE